MHVILRCYKGAADRMTQAAPKAQQGLVPLLRGHEGFHGYAAIASEQGDILSCSVFDDAAQAQRSNEQVHGWVQQSLKDIMPEAPPAVNAGDVMLHALAGPRGGGEDQPLY